MKNNYFVFRKQLKLFSFFPISLDGLWCRLISYRSTLRKGSLNFVDIHLVIYITKSVLLLRNSNANPKPTPIFWVIFLIKNLLSTKHET